MSDSEYYVTAAEFFGAVEKAFTKVYLAEKEEAFYEQKWHPEDISVNVAVIMESIGEYSYHIMSERRKGKNGA